MGKIETVMRSEIGRLARRELRSVCVPLARDVRTLKRTVSALKRTVTALGRVAKQWNEQVVAQTSELRAPEEEVKSARFSAGLIRKLRKRLGLSQAEIGKLVDVSSVTVWSWEQGRSRPSGSNRHALVALRKLGRRDVKRLLERNKQ